MKQFCVTLCQKITLAANRATSIHARQGTNDRHDDEEEEETFFWELTDWIPLIQIYPNPSPNSLLNSHPLTSKKDDSNTKVI